MKTHLRLLCGILSAGICCIVPASGQSCHFEGLAVHAGSGTPIPFVHVGVVGTRIATTCDQEGRFAFSLPRQERYAIWASHVGYRNDTVRIDVSCPASEIRIVLQQAPILMKTVDVRPEEDPAYDIIRKAIAVRDADAARVARYSVRRQHKWRSLISPKDASEDFDSTAAAGRRGTQEAVSWYSWFGRGEDRTLVEAHRWSDTSDGMRGIGMVDAAWPDISSGASTRVSACAYPLSQEGLEEYACTLDSTFVSDETNVHVITMRPQSGSSLVKKMVVYVEQRSARVLGTVLEFVQREDGIYGSCATTIVTKYSLYEDAWWMPSAVYQKETRTMDVIWPHSLVTETFLVASRYRFNEDVAEDIFASPDLVIADSANTVSDSVWQHEGLIRQTEAEKAQYAQKARAAAEERQQMKEYTWWDRLVRGRYRDDERGFESSGLIPGYHFNRVEGHALSLEFAARFTKKQSRDSTWWHWVPMVDFRALSVSLQYSFADQRLKPGFKYELWLQRDHDAYVSFEHRDRLAGLDDDSYLFGSAMTSVTSILARHDLKDYYYTNEYKIGSGGWLSHDVHLNAVYMHNDDRAAQNNTTWSWSPFAARYRKNATVDHVLRNAVTLSLVFDPGETTLRDGCLIKSSAPSAFRASMTVSHRWVYEGGTFRGDPEAYSYEYAAAAIEGLSLSWFAGESGYQLRLELNSEPVPLQARSFVRGSDIYYTDRFHFRTVRYVEFGGDMLGSAYLEHMLPRGVSRILPRIPILRPQYWTFHLFGGWARALLYKRSRFVQDPRSVATSPCIIEAGAGVGNIFGFLRIDFTWRVPYQNTEKTSAIQLSVGMP